MLDVNHSIEVRPARAEDKDPILAFTQNTFSWGDYIPHVWDRWLSDSQGRIFVGLVDGRPVAMLHVAVYHATGWMEGMRVHPEFRRMGIGKAVDAVARDWARQAGARTIQLATAIDNLPAHRTLDAEGYVRVAAFKEWSAAAEDSPVPMPRVGTLEDIPEVLAWWAASPLRTTGHLLLPDPYWHWTELSEERLRWHVDEGQLRVASKGFSLLSTWENGDDKEMNLHAVVGDAESMRSFALAARAEAARRGYPRVAAMLADDPALDSIMGQAGYTTDGAMLIYEQAL